MDKLSYALGMSIAHNMMHSGVDKVDFNDFKNGLEAVMTGKQPELPVEEAGKVLDEYFQKLEAEAAAKQAEVAEVMKKQGAGFLEANKQKEGVVTLPSGLQYKVLKEGNGSKMPSATDQVKCHYEGRLTDGTVFDSSYKRGEPAVFGLNQVIKGWTEGLQLMNEGAKWELYLPYDLAYGETGAAGAIPPYAALIFTVELLEVL